MKKTVFSKLILIALVLIYLIVFKDFPYFNLVLQAKVIGGLTFVLAVFLFSIPAELLLKTGVVLLLPTLFLTLRHQSSLAELIGELIYLLLILGFIQKFNDFRRLVYP